MSAYDEAQQLRKRIIALIDERINANANVKSAIKAKKARIINPPVNGKVDVNIIGDIRLDVINTPNIISLPYSSRLSAEDLAVGNIVSVWYNYSLNNGIVMQNANWTK